MSIKLRNWLGAAALAFFLASVPSIDSKPVQLDTVEHNLNPTSAKHEQDIIDAYDHMTDEERMEGIIYE